MSKWESVYVPDDVWAEFVAGRVDHFEYGDPISVAVYADGRRVEFNSVVSDEMREDARKARIVEMENSGGFVTGVRFQATLRRRTTVGTVHGWTI